MTRSKRQTSNIRKADDRSSVTGKSLDYTELFDDITLLLESARRISAKAVNAIMTATYFEIGRRIVEYEQRGEKRAAYGEKLLKRLSTDLGKRFGRGFGVDNLQRFRAFYLIYPQELNSATLSRKSTDKSLNGKYATTSRISSPSKKAINQTRFGLSHPAAHLRNDLDAIAARFPLTWSAYVRLLSIKNANARKFYETEALRGGWSVRQLDRQINTQFYERTALSRNKAAILEKGQKRARGDVVAPEEEIKDPYVLEFLDLKDEYSETDLEEALIRRLEHFLLELGGDFSFVGRQKRLRIGDEWYRVDLLFFHRRLRCLVVIDIKLGKFTHADAGQMHMYLNYAGEHWTKPEENPPVGLILCARKDEALVRYTLDNLPNKVLAAEYRTTLPEEKLIAREMERTRRMLDIKHKSHSSQKRKKE
ncbi:DUF1016 family protein [Candidatus Sumerlaeota bacterium]|nr:DUF1016 family protein [Candidatus Sumerlaeota bacterium]